MTHDNSSQHKFATSSLSASVTANGAELCELRDASGQDYLWPASPAWPRHAPVLFPIVGRLREDTLLHQGHAYRMTQHGFARDHGFTWVERSSTGCVLKLNDDVQTRSMYPFGFQFEIKYAMVGATLEITYTIVNTAQETLPASMGAHPAFRWPLVSGIPKEAYALTFEAEETGPIRGLAGGLLTDVNRSLPIIDKKLALSEALFTDDALIFEHPASRSIRYGAAEGPSLTVAWDGFTQLGLWSRAGGDFVCIEPWCGMASPAGFGGEFCDKPGLFLIPPGESRTAIHRITINI